MKIYLIIKIALMLAIFGGFLALDTPGQTGFFRTCAGKNATVKQSKIELDKTGNVNLTPCAGKSLLFNGQLLSNSFVALNGLTASTQSFAAGANDAAGIASSGATHTINFPINSVTGTARTGTIPIFTGANALGKSFISQAANTLLFNVPNSATFNTNEFNAFALDGINLNTLNFVAGDHDGNGNNTAISIIDSVSAIQSTAANGWTHNGDFKSTGSVTGGKLQLSADQECLGTGTINGATGTLSTPCVFDSDDKVFLQPTTQRPGVYQLVQGSGSSAQGLGVSSSGLVINCVGDCAGTKTFNYFIVRSVS